MPTWNKYPVIIQNDSKNKLKATEKEACYSILLVGK